MSPYPWSHEARYDNAKLIAEGGMGAVYSARDANLERTVAIKVIRSALAKGVDYRKRMRREIAALSKLEHPNIVRLFECNESPEGELYFTMEFVEGRELNQYVQEESLKTKEVVTLFLGLLSAISALHEVNIIHRDIKAANVLVTEGGIAKLIDLGLAHFADIRATPITKSHQVVGTLAYLPPEVGRGEPYTERSDIFQVAYALDLALRDDSGNRRSSYPPELIEIVERAESDSPQSRYASANEFHRALSHWLRRRTSQSRKAPPSTSDKVTVGKPPLLLITLLFIFGIGYQHYGRVGGEAFFLRGVRLQNPKTLLILFRGKQSGELFIKLSPQSENLRADLALSRSLPGGQKALKVLLPHPILNERQIEIHSSAGVTKQKINGRDYVEGLLNEVDSAVKAKNYRLTTRLGHLAFAFSQLKGDLTDKRKDFETDLLNVLADEGIPISTIADLKEFVPLYLGKEPTIFSAHYRRCQPLTTIETAMAMSQTLPPPWGRLTTRVGVKFQLAKKPFPMNQWSTVCEKKLSTDLRDGELWYWLSPPIAPRLALANLQTIQAAANLGGSGGPEGSIFDRREWLPDENQIHYQIDVADFTLPKAPKYALLFEMKFFHRSGVLQIILSNGLVGELFNTSALDLQATNFVYRRHMYWLVPIKEEEMRDVEHITVKLRRIHNFGTLPILALRQVKLLALK